MKKESQQVSSFTPATKNLILASLNRKCGPFFEKLRDLLTQGAADSDITEEIFDICSAYCEMVLHKKKVPSDEIPDVNPDVEILDALIQDLCTATIDFSKTNFTSVVFRRCEIGVTSALKKRTPSRYECAAGREIQRQGNMWRHVVESSSAADSEGNVKTYPQRGRIKHWCQEPTYFPCELRKHIYRGKWQEGVLYQRNDLVDLDGKRFLCESPTESEPNAEIHTLGWSKYKSEPTKLYTNVVSDSELQREHNDSDDDQSDIGETGTLGTASRRPNRLAVAGNNAQRTVESALINQIDIDRQNEKIFRAADKIVEPERRGAFLLLIDGRWTVEELWNMFAAGQLRAVFGEYKPVSLRAFRKWASRVKKKTVLGKGGPLYEDDGYLYSEYRLSKDFNLRYSKHKLLKNAKDVKYLHPIQTADIGHLRTMQERSKWIVPFRPDAFEGRVIGVQFGDERNSRGISRGDRTEFEKWQAADRARRAHPTGCAALTRRLTTKEKEREKFEKFLAALSPAVRASLVAHEDRSVPQQIRPVPRIQCEISCSICGTQKIVNERVAENYTFICKNHSRSGAKKWLESREKVARIEGAQGLSSNTLIEEGVAA